MGGILFFILLNSVKLFNEGKDNMAYNVLKGVVEGSVDQHGDQEIEGRKVFTNTISASVFYDTDAGAPCATIKDVAITGALKILY